MRKAPVTSVALVAALFILAVPAVSGARIHHGKRVTKRAQAGSVTVSESFAAPKLPADPGLLAGGPQARSPKRRVRANRIPRLIHQVGLGEVVLDSTEVVTAEGSRPEVVTAEGLRPEVVTAEGSRPEVAGGLPPEAYDLPETPCPSEDPPIIEAHVHVADADPDAEPIEKEDGEVVLPHRQESSQISKLARRLGSLFRPKSANARVRPRDVDLSELLAQNLLIPVEGVDRAKLRDSFLESRGQYARHLAIDIGAPRGTPILATDDGEIVKLTREGRGGITIYQKDLSGRYLFFYCHLSRYARGLRVGGQVSKGEVIGYVGATGHVIGGAHLHFSITRLPEDRDNLREGLAINPYLLFLAGVP
ncbi:MAG TPA: M23 family metallopeptidase [Thermoanaerobaculia bacterium]|nr:M23 family metallopeptidase [Thermoanaerobaculia bacterium]